MTQRSYANALASETRDLIAAARAGGLPRPRARDDLIERVRALVCQRQNVLLVGAAGVGKTSIVHGLAHCLQGDDQFRELREFNTAGLLTNTLYVGEWETKLDEMLKALRKRKGLLYVQDPWNLDTVGASSSSPSMVLDTLLPHLQTKTLVLIAEAPLERYQQMLARPALVGLFEEIGVEPLDRDGIVAVASDALAAEKRTVPSETVLHLVDLTRRFLAQDHGPGRMLTLIRQVVDYHDQKLAAGESEPLDSHFIDKAFSIYSGLPLFIVSEAHTQSTKRLREWFRARVMGQDEAVEAVVEAITLFKAGLQDPQRPLGTFLFVGPTGVGKTELAKALAEFLFGSANRLLRFDMSEFKTYNAFEMLVGAPYDGGSPAGLLDPVSKQPFQVILLDEIEKGHPNIWDLLLQLLDEGRVSGPRTGAVDFRNTIVIVTSNVAANEAQRPGIGFSDVGTGDGTVSVESLESVFRPELLNRFQFIVSFKPLKHDMVIKIARKELAQILERRGVVGRNLIIDVGDAVLDEVVKRGFNQRYGARALKRQLQSQIVLPLATYLMEHTVDPGTILKLELDGAHVRIRRIETQESREARQDRQPVRGTLGGSYTREALSEGCLQLGARISALHAGIDSAALRGEREALRARREAPDFWDDPEQAQRQFQRSDRITEVLARVERLEERQADLARALTGPLNRTSLALRAADYEHLAEAVDRAELELIQIGETGNADALVELRSLGPACPLRDRLGSVYRDWALWRGLEVALLCEPIAEADPVLLWVQGPYAAGYLLRESGLHRHRERDVNSAVKVTVAALSERREPERFGHHRALKANGGFGGRIRSRLEVEQCRGLVLQNEATLNTNRDTATMLAASWRHGAIDSNAVVRRYDEEPFLIKDYAAQLSAGRRDVLKPKAFDELLVRRIRAIPEARVGLGADGDGQGQE